MCWFTGTAEKIIGSCIPAKKTRICVFPILVVLENDLFGGGVRIGGFPSFADNPEAGNGFEVDVSVLVGAGWAIDSWRSCAQGASAGFEVEGVWLYHVKCGFE